VSDQEIGIVLQCLPPPEAVQLLVDLANLRGGPDNITVIVARALENFADHGEALSQPGPGINPLTWILMAATLIFAGTLAVVSRPLIALIAGVVGLIITLATLARGRAGGEDSHRGRFGRGPHKAWSCKPDSAIAQELARVFEQLRAAAVEEDWRMDWSHIENLTRRAQQAIQSKQFSAAVASYGRAISFMMRELKNQTDT
jgi:protein phosphatase